ncbi:MAG: hypothetical protein RL497_1843 [Pseudomonadota bacterium]|jgi:hypothetical protein
MQQLTQAGQNFVNSLAQRYNLSADAVVHMLVAVNNGGGSMAQFNCPELGGGGQWMQGGMTMVGDMFNNGLKNTVDNLCRELAAGLANMQIFPVIPAGTPGSAQWWPLGLGVPFSSGSQNNSRYALFPQRLAVEHNGQVTVYDTLDHAISGVSQQQGSDASLTFSSQYGTLSVASLPVIANDKSAAQQTHNPNFLASPTPNNIPAAPIINSEQPIINSAEPVFNTNAAPSNQSSNEILGLIEGLAKLVQAGVLTQDEFNIKKSELLSRL